MPALFGLAVLLFLPSLFAWSVAVLKEPLFVLINALSLMVAVNLARSSSFGRRALAAVGTVALAAVLESVRPGGATFTLVGLALGLAIACVAVRPRLMLAALVAAPILLGAIFQPSRCSARRRTRRFKAPLGSTGAPSWSRQGHGYRLLDDRFYPSTQRSSSLEFSETMRFLVRAVGAYVTVPRPWEAQSRAAAAYIPEQVIWYVLAALAPVGIRVRISSRSDRYGAAHRARAS